MNPLTSEERDKIAHHLSHSARAGGWFFIFMAIFVFVLILLPLLGVGNFDRWDPELIGVFIPLVLAFAVPGWWLLGRKKHTRTMLDGALLEGTAEVLEIDHSDPSSGWFVTLRVKTPSYTEVESKLHGYGQPPWHVGEQIELLFTADEGRYFPRYLSHHTNIGRIHTIDEQDTNRRWGTIVLMILGGLVLIGFSIGFYGGVTGQ